jgi:hypothetical protein
MVPLTLTAIVGGVLTCIALWPAGVLIALASAPVGGSLAAAATGLVIARSRRDGAEHPASMAPALSPERPVMDLQRPADGPQPV